MKKNHFELKKLCYGNRCFYFGGCSRDSYFFRVCAEICTGEFSEYFEDKCAETK